MLKKFLLLLCCVVNTATCGAALAECEQALPSNHSQFCSSFSEVAKCHCREIVTPVNIQKYLCSDAKFIHAKIIAQYGTVDRACSIQKHTDKQTCVDAWRCYIHGGINSRGEPCSSTTSACQ